MFRTGSPYSPFFTSGLLSSPEPPSSRSSSPPPFLGPRRGSLPTDTPSPSTDQSSAFYFTLQPKRDPSEFRSFLSLDLAESQSLRSASLKRKASSSSKAPSGSSRPENKFLSTFPNIPEVPRTLAPPHAPLRLRMSRDSLRTIPSPKPAPSITLPDLPTASTSCLPSPFSSAPPRLPSIAINPSLGLTLERASQSAPSLVISRTPAPPAIHALPKRFSTITQTTSSSVSTRVRRINRSDALARLEGRSKSEDLPIFKPMAMSKPKAVERNFMSMSDDEDDSGSESDFDIEKRAALSITLEPEDVVLPIFSPMRLQTAKSAPVSGRFPSLISSRSSRRKQQRSTKDWFPLNSFIDLRNDDEMSGWSWRSFIEVASVS